MSNQLIRNYTNSGQPYLHDEEGEFVKWLPQEEGPRENPEPSDHPSQEDSSQDRFEHFRAANPSPVAPTSSTTSKSMADSPTEKATETVQQTGSEALELVKSNAAMILLGDVAGEQLSKFVQGALQGQGIPSWAQKTITIVTPALAGGFIKSTFSNKHTDGLALGHAITTIRHGVDEVLGYMGGSGGDSTNGGDSSNGGDDAETQVEGTRGLAGTKPAGQLAAQYATNRATSTEAEVATSRATGAGQQEAMMPGT